MNDIPTPKGVRRNWDKVSISTKNVEGIFGYMAENKTFINACAWCDQNDNVRVIAGDTECGVRYIIKYNKRSTTLIINHIKDI